MCYIDRFCYKILNIKYITNSTGIEKTGASIHTNDKVFYQSSEATLPNHEIDLNINGKYFQVTKSPAILLL